jgi:hypothetical protein
MQEKLEVVKKEKEQLLEDLIETEYDMKLSKKFNLIFIINC